MNFKTAIEKRFSGVIVSVYKKSYIINKISSIKMLSEIKKYISKVKFRNYKLKSREGKTNKGSWKIYVQKKKRGKYSFLTKYLLPLLLILILIFYVYKRIYKICYFK